MNKHKQQDNEEESKLPAWKASLLKRKQEGQEEDAADQEPAPKVIEGSDKMPAWKAALLNKKQEAEEKERLEKIAREEGKYQHLPEWKIKLVKKKEAEKEAAANIERAKNQAMLDKKAEIAAMPEWKRKLFLQKNPEYS